MKPASAESPREGPMSTIFGPVPSRRLGRSLGIDLLPHKTCSYNCVYCESGPITSLTLERRVFVDPDTVLRELGNYLGQHPDKADVLTFSGAGEPTLYLSLGHLIRRIKKGHPSYPLNVLTNGSLLWDPQVRRDLMEADRVIPSLDAAIEQVFRRVNRPHPRLELSVILEGLRAFRQEYLGSMHVEVVLVRGINDSREAIESLQAALDSLEPDRVELNTVVRPPAVQEIQGLDLDEMEEARRILGPERTEIIGVFTHRPSMGSDPDLQNRVLALVRRRPCSSDEMARSLGVALEELDCAVKKLQEDGKISRQQFGDRDFFVSKKGKRGPSPGDFA